MKPQFATLDSPAAREAWKYSNLQPLAAGEFSPLEQVLLPDGNLPLLPGLVESHRVVVWNGRLLSTPDTLNESPDTGVDLAPAAEAAATPASGNPDLPGDLIGEAHTRQAVQPLVLTLAAGATPDRPVEVIFVSDGQATGRRIAPRLQITAATGSRATVVERHVYLGDGPSLSLPLTTVACAPGSGLTHVKIIADGREAFHYGQTRVRQEQDSRYRSAELLLAGASVRRELHVDLAGEGAACDLHGLTITGGDRRCDVRTRVHHLVPGCVTNELYKGVHAGRGQGVFDGLIRVARDAQQTQAFQTNRNLLLSADAVSYSIPRLEIYADDVKCSHGSTTGQLSDEELFYLRSRGFDAAMARRMLSYAFASEVVEALEDRALREELTARVHKLLDEVQA